MVGYQRFGTPCCLHLHLAGQQNSPPSMGPRVREYNVYYYHTRASRATWKLSETNFPCFLNLLTSNNLITVDLNTDKGKGKVEHHAIKEYGGVKV